MFSSGGYFRSVNCPFFVHGLCHRPYCHFRHAKPGHGSTTKNAVVKSCLKSKVNTTGTKCGTEGTSSSKSLKRSTNEESVTKSSPDPKPIVQAQNNATKTNTNSLTNIKDADEPPQSKELPSSKEESEKKDLPRNSKKIPSFLDSLEKIEQAVNEASESLLIHNNAKVLSCSASNNPKDSKRLSKNQSLVSTEKNDQATKEDSNNKIENKGEEIARDLQSEECQDINISTDSNKSAKCSGIDEISVSKDRELKITDNELEKLVKVDAKKISMDSSWKGIEDVSRETPPDGKSKDQKIESTVLGKKRKSSNINNMEMKKAKIKKQNSHEDSAKLERKGSSSDSKDASKTEKTHIPTSNKRDNCDRKHSTLKQKQKTNPELKVVDLDFFSSPKKVKLSKTYSKEKTKSKKEPSKEERKAQNCQSQLKTLRRNSDSKRSMKQKLKQNESKEKIYSRKSKVHDNITKDTSVPLTTSLFESDDEVRFSSDSLSGSESDTDPVDSSTEMLREIFDNYDPQRDLRNPSSNTKKVKESSSRSSRMPSTSSTPEKEMQQKAVDLPGLGKKQRVAHTASYLVQRKSSNINPIRRVPKTTASSSSASSTQDQSKEYNLLQGKKRVAHQPRPASQSSLPRPRIPIEYGAKVPQSFRQRYLDKIVDEHLRLSALEQEAFDKAVEEERGLYNRSTRRHMYLNLCINAIKNLRSQPTPEHQPESTQPNTATATVSTRRVSATAIDSQSPKKIDVDHLTEEMFYNLLFPYILTEEELVENGFPRSSLTTPGKVTFKSRKPKTTPSKDPNRRICCRCGTPYTVLEDGTYFRPEECVYHVGRLLKRRIAGEVTTTYSCCGGDGSTPGCAVGKVHVSEGKDATEGFMTTIVSPLAGNQKKVFAVDCEMCYTVAGLELTRATVVDWKLEKIYDTFVKPDNPVLDYNTRFSGVTEECLRGVKTSIREVQAVLLSIIHRDSILVGHSLESDLLALKLVHSKVVDTSVVFPHRLGPPYKRALRTLTAEFLKQIIQDDEAGHDSHEDAKASLELMLYKAKEDLKKKERNKK
ncbi:RNA exonuclease 1 homolog [Actinia tenebrosa]|uniref:RNA exonuclease 1 homolog n=1 Tax=Actinia tenebrosa TaxID=6105 RepID=A0A6P8HE05_ACTTE|nr:RNA exonuclease 1 homolog [Actinia tenebrosa]